MNHRNRVPNGKRHQALNGSSLPSDDDHQLAEGSDTAFALDELSEHDQSLLEREIASHPERAQAISESKELGNLLIEAIAAEQNLGPSPQLRNAVLDKLDRQTENESIASQREQIEAEHAGSKRVAKELPPHQEVWSRRRPQIFWIGSTVCLLAVTLGYLIWQRAFQPVVQSNVRQISAGDSEMAATAQSLPGRDRASDLTTAEFQIRARDSNQLADLSSPSLPQSQDSLITSLSVTPEIVVWEELDTILSIYDGALVLDNSTFNSTEAWRDQSDFMTENKVVQVPDGGTVLLGGIHREAFGDYDVWYSRERGIVVTDGRSLSSDELQSGERYELPNENPFLSVIGRQALSTFAIDVDSAAYANVRRFLNDGQLPPTDAVRIEEMVNYFDYDDPAPGADDPLALSMEIANCPWTPGHRLLRVAVTGKTIERDQRPKSNLVFLVDVSGSMEDANKLPLLQQSLTMLTDRLSESDRIAIVVYADDARVVLGSTNGTQRTKIREAIDALRAEGSTHGSAGIELAYQIARENFIEEGVNRVILATDGDLNVGVTDDDALIELISEQAAGGTFLTVLGVGSGNLQDAKLEKIADHGNGMYAYLDSLREAQRVLLEQMSETFVAIAKDVKIQLEFNPKHVSNYRLIGYENRQLAAEQFRDDSVDAGELGAGHSVVAFYELTPVGIELEPSAPAPVAPLRYQQSDGASDAEASEKLEEIFDEFVLEQSLEHLTEFGESDEWLFAQLRYKLPDSDEALEIGQSATDVGLRLEDTSDDFRFSAAVAGLGMLLRNSQFSGSTSLELITDLAESGLGEQPDETRVEFLDLVRKVSELRQGQ